MLEAQVWETRLDMSSSSAAYELGDLGHKVSSSLASISSFIDGLNERVV